jgi:hypothetical protein
MIYVQGGSTILDPGILETIIPFGASGVWVAPFSGYAIFLAIGGGGAGGVNSQSNAGGVISKATGGGAGALCMRRVIVTQGQSFTIGVGAGGAGATQTGASSGGASGTASTIVGSGVNMSAGGGTGGAVANNAATAAGGAGGIATGGDVNYSGSAGGEILSAQPNGGFAKAMATGGGGPNVFNILNPGGAILDGALLGSTNAYATGGGGINGGAAPDYSNFAVASGGTTGRGSAGGDNTLFQQIALTLFGLSFVQVFQTSNLVGGQLRFFGGNGGGSVGSGVTWGGGVAGFMGGGGAAAGGYSAAALAAGFASSGGLGSGGGGGALAAIGAAGAVSSGAGGQGLVLIRLTKSN